MSETSTPSVWFITGASRGLGREIAAAALARGDAVAATARDPGQIAEVLGESASLLPLALDVTDEAAAHAAVAQTVERFGRLDVVVNNAGFGLLGAVEETDRDQVQALLDTNVHGTLNVLRAALPQLRAQRAGHIINISSLGGFAASAGNGAYGATKFAVEGLSEALAAELKPLGIKVTIVEPGYLRTDFLASRSIVHAARRVEDYDRSFNRHLAEERSGHQPGDPAKAAAAICAVVDAAEPPLRLALGTDALARMRAKLAAVAAELGRWESLSQTTDFDTPSVMGANEPIHAS